MSNIYFLIVMGLFSMPEFSRQLRFEDRNTEFIKTNNARIVTSYKQSGFLQQVPAFKAEIREKRTADNRTGDAVYLQRYNRVTINVENVFDTYTGIFTAPSEGLYHFSGSFLIDDFQCWTGEFLRNPVSFDVSIVKNNTEIAEVYKFPVVYNQQNNQRPSSSGKKFNLLLKLQPGETIRLKVLSKKCDDRFEPFFSNVIFCGFKVY
jgi:hypothetical protein